MMKALQRRIGTLERLLMGGQRDDPSLSQEVFGRALRLLSGDDLDVLEIVWRDRAAGQDAILNESQLASIERFKAALEQTCPGAALLAEYARSQA